MPRTERLLLAGSASQGLLPPALASAMCRALPTVESALIDGLADFRLPGDDTENFEASDLATGALLAAVSQTCAPRLELGSELFLPGRGAPPASARCVAPPLPTGVPEIDALLHQGRGLPRGGLLTEIYGGPSSGKTQLALAAAATTAAAPARGRVLWLDACSGGGGGGGGAAGNCDNGANPFPGRRLAALVAAASGLAPPPPPPPPAAPSSSAAEAEPYALPAALEAALERIVVVPVSRISEASAALDLAVVAAEREGAREQRGRRRREGPSSASFDLIVLDSAASLFGPVLGGGGGGGAGGGAGGAGASGAGHAAMVSFVRSLKAAAAALGAAALVTNHERPPSQQSLLLASSSSSLLAPLPPPPPPALGESWRPQATLRLRLSVARDDSPPLAGGPSGSGSGRGSRGGGAAAAAGFVRTAQLVKGGSSVPIPWVLPLSG